MRCFCGGNERRQGLVLLWEFVTADMMHCGTVEQHLHFSRSSFRFYQDWASDPLVLQGSVSWGIKIDDGLFKGIKYLWATVYWPFIYTLQLLQLLLQN